MKRYFSFFSAMLLIIGTSAQAQEVPTSDLLNKQAKSGKKLHAVSYGRTKSLHELQKQLKSNRKAGVTKRSSNAGEINVIRMPEQLLKRGKQRQEVEQREGVQLSRAFDFLPTGNTPIANLSVEGFSNDDNAAINGGMITPPDTNGDVGLTHYVQYVNLGWVFFNKDGTRAGNPMPGNVFWQGFGGVCESENAGDPIVVYDHLAGRWLFSQFTGTSVPDGHQCVAISDGEDPAGPYTLYDFVVSPNGFNDYPKIAVWPDGYYMTTHEFSPGFTGVNVSIFATIPLQVPDRKSWNL